MSLIPPLEPLDCEGDSASVGLRWEKWKRALELYLTASNIINPETKRATLLHMGGLALQEFFYNIPGAHVEADSGNVYEIALSKLDEYFSPKQSRVYERHLFRLIKQEQGEKFEKFLVRLRHQSSKCRFISSEEHMIDQITEKCESVELRKRILTLGDEITLDKIVFEANSLETVNRQLYNFGTSSTGDQSINRLELKFKDSVSDKCTRCGGSHSKDKNICPARDKKCLKCGFVGHFRNCCRTRAIKRKSSVPFKVDVTTKKPKTRALEVDYIFHLDNDDSIMCTLGGVEIDMLIDSGSKCNIINDITWKNLKSSGVQVKNLIKSPQKEFRAYGAENPLTVLGSFDSSITVGINSKTATFYVIKDGTRNLLGKNTAMELGVLKVGLHINLVENTAFPKFKNIKIHIPINESVKPVSQPCRRVPIPLEHKINNKIKELIEADIIETVDSPSDWISPLVPVLKENGDIRICVDMRQANRAIIREKHPLPTIEQLIPQFRNAKIFSKLDIKNAFHQLEISEDSRYITTFICNRGLFRYKRLMFGISCAPECFQKVLERILLPCKGVVNFIDDIVIFGSNEAEHDVRLKEVLKVLSNYNVLLNQSKCVYRVKQVNFLGHQLSCNGIKPLDRYVKTIESFGNPVTIEEVQSFLGLVNYVSKWIPNLATLTEPLRDLIKLKLGKGVNIYKYWRAEHSNSFKKLKQAMTKIETLGYYDPNNNRTQVFADASPVGLGAVLVQHDSSGPRIIAYGNKSLTDREKRYCQTEKEALALVWAVEHFHLYLFGMDSFELVSDHKPLEVIFGPNSKPCARIERWVLRLQSYNFKIVYSPGKNNIADSLSRLCRSTDIPQPFDNDNYVNLIVAQIYPTAIQLNELKHASEVDAELKLVRNGIISDNWDQKVNNYKYFAHELCCQDNLVLRGNKLVIPVSMRNLVLAAAHEGHPGIVAMKTRLRSKVWWPKIDNDAEHYVRSCKGCTLVSFSPNPPNPMRRREIPVQPWIDVAIDFLGPLPSGHFLLVIIDYFSRYKEIKVTKSIDSTHTIAILKEIFSRLGIPVSITADNGRQFTSTEFGSFCKEYGIRLFHSIPYWPQQNGEVERQNRDILKRLRISQSQRSDWQDDLLKYLMMYNSTPHSTTGKSPSELFYRRQFRDKLPSIIDIEFSDIDLEAKDRDTIMKAKGKEYSDRKRGATASTINVADKVYIKNATKDNKLATTFGDTTHTVINKNGTDVEVENDLNGNRLRRNIVHLKKVEGQWKVCSEDNERCENACDTNSGGPSGSGVSVSTQADIAHSAKGYESEDENAGRKRQKANDDRPTSKTTMYSKQEFREQYCINNKQLDLLELEKSKKDRFLGCLSQYHIESPCSRANRSSFLSVCVRRRVPSDENLNTDYAPIQRFPRFGQPAPAPPEVCAYDADLECSYFRRRPRSVCSQPDPKRYTWMPEDEDFTRMEWPQSVIEDNAGWPQNYSVDQIASVSRGGSLPRPPSIIPCPAHTPIPPPPPPPPLTIPPHRTKHVSFARSHTLTTFDDSVMPAAVSGSRFRRDCERLIDGRVVKPENKPYATLPVMFQPFPPYPQYMTAQAPAPIHYPPPIAPLPAHTIPPVQRPTQTEIPKVVVLDSIKKGVMRTQATQTEVCLGRKPLPPNYLSLSPRTIKRVKMVAAGVQTNGYTVGVRRLTKSFSEVGGDRLAGRDTQTDVSIDIESIIGTDHEKLHRTQSEEPPRSPRSPTSVIPTSPIIQRGDSDDVTSSSIKSIASSQVDKSSELSILQRQAQEYFQQNFQFIHESDRDDTIDDDMETIEKSMALNRRNLEYLQQEIAKQAKGERSLRSILSKSTSDASHKTLNSSHHLSKTSTFQSEPSTETSATTTDDSEKNEKEIIIDFEPRPDEEAIPFTTLRRKNKRILQKTLSEGEILLDARKTEMNTEGIKDAPIVMSTSQENMTKEDREREAKYRQYIAQNYSQTPIKDEGIFGFEPDGSFSSSDGNAPYEDFHEKYISYKHEPFRIRSVSFEEKPERVVKEEIPLNGTAKSSPASPDPISCNVDVEQKTKLTTTKNNITTILAPLEKSSPCASSESLTVDQSRDHSDGMWNESQTTVLQVDSGTDNGTVVSSSDLSSLATSPGALALLTPTSRRKQLLLLQHQQRSSLDTDALDEEFDASQSQSPTSPRNKLDTSSSSSAQQTRASLSPPAVVPNITLPITKQPTISKSLSPTISIKPNHTPAIAITHPSLDLSDVPFKRTPSFINKKRERALSPSRRQELQRKAHQKEPNGTIPNQIVESPSEPSLAKPASSETSLARTDSGKINTTDVSESTTTTEDYVTANSDSSKKSNCKNQNHNSENNNKAQEGSSFESASSLYSSTKTDNVAEDLIVPSFSPPLEISDDFIVPNLSSPPLPLPDRLPKTTVEKIEVKADITPIETNRRIKSEVKKPKDEVPKKTISRDAISGKSSSSGSYSIGGSNPNVTESVTDKVCVEKIKELPEKPETKVKEEKKASSNEQKEQLVPKMVGSLSDDERSVHYSSSGYYESPIEDDDDGAYKHSQKYRSTGRPKSWISDDKRRKKKAFTLEFSKSYDDSISTSQDDWGKKDKDPEPSNHRSSFKPISSKLPLEEKNIEPRKKKTHFVEKTKSVQSSPRDVVDIEKSIKERIIKEKENDNKRPNERERYVKRTKLKAKSPTQNKTIDGSYRQGHYDRRDNIGSNVKLHLNIPTSDDSSEQYRKNGTGNGNISPRKHRRLRDSPRRKTGNNNNSAKSPTSSNHSTYRPRRKSGSNESISLPGSLPRRKQSIPTIPCLSSLEAEDIETARTLNSAGSRLTPLRYVKSPSASPRHHKKQGQADGKFAKAASAESLRSVSPGSDSVFYSEHTEHDMVGAECEAKAHCLHCGKEVHIVTATHDHDSRASRTSHTDESYADATPDIVPAPAGFADSPSCGAAKKPATGARLYKKLDKRYRSEDKSRHYRHRQDVRAKSEERGKEEYSGMEKTQDTRIARSAGNSLDKLAGSNASVDPDEHEECSGSSDGAEDEKGVYATPWWCGNWILLSENDDNWTRIPPDMIEPVNPQEDPTESETEFNKRYVALTHRLVHRRACIELNRRQSNNTFESDKTVVVRRGNEEFGFRIHGSKPVVVSAIEPDTPAESSGLEVGDIIIAVNGINVLDKTHSEVVKIAHSGSEILELDVARTCEVVASLAHEGGPAALYSGYLWRAAPARAHLPPRWTRRWFVLKRDNCLYYYKTDSSIHPVGALMLVNYQLTEEDAGRAHGFRLQRGGGTRLQLAADTAEAAARWRAVLAHAIDASNQRDGWLEVTMRNMKLPPSSIPRPDCFGYLMKLGSKWKSWAKRYCVLKDACLYFYNDGNSKNAFGMACLHGYRIQTCSPGGKKYAFEVMPTEPKQRHFYFHTESEMDRKRWMAALEYSIDRWMKAG